MLRCTGVAANCANYSSSKGQVQPPAVQTGAAISSSTLSQSQLQLLKQQAITGGTYWAAGSCPTSASLGSTAGYPVYVEGPCDLSVASNAVINSAASPGALVIANGTFTMTGSSTFYGLLYLVNLQGSSGNVLSVQGNATVQGAVAIDGLGSASLGSSKTNLVYDQRAAGLLQGSAGAVINKSTWRELPSNTP
jgi:hypothetical protein